MYSICNIFWQQWEKVRPGVTKGKTMKDPSVLCFPRIKRLYKYMFKDRQTDKMTTTELLYTYLTDTTPK